MKKLNKNTGMQYKSKTRLRFFCILLIQFFLLAGCMIIKKSDASTVKLFKKQGINLIFQDYKFPEGNIHYATTGADDLPVLVFIHGSPGGWNEFKSYLSDSTLVANFRIISIDRPGFGASDYKKALHLQQQADLVAGLLKQIEKGKPIYLIGHSYGGPLAALLAFDNPNLVSGIVILAGALDPALEAKEKWRTLFLKGPLKSILPGTLSQSIAELWYLKKDLVELKEKLPLVTCPVYVLHAKNDMFVSFKNTDYMKAQFTGAPVKIMPFETGNHFIPENKHHEIVTLLTSFAAVKKEAQ